MRGLSNKFINDLMDGELQSFWNKVISDEALNPEIRNGHLTIYYRGGKVCKVEEKYSEYLVGDFDKKYASNPDYPEHSIFIKDMEYWNIQEWSERLHELETIMDIHMSYPENLPRREDSYLQDVVWENNRSEASVKTDYFIIDTQTNINFGKVGYVDAVALIWQNADHNLPNNKKMAFIEAKHGAVALSGKAGIRSHVDDWAVFLRNQKRWVRKQEEMKNVFYQKIKLGLIPAAPLSISKLSLEIPELLLLLTDISPTDNSLHNELCGVAVSESYASLLSDGTDIKIGILENEEYALYMNRFTPLREFLKEQGCTYIEKQKNDLICPEKLASAGTNIKMYYEWQRRTSLTPNVSKLLFMLFEFADENKLNTNFPEGFSLSTQNGLPLIWDYKGNTSGSRKLVPQLKRLRGRMSKIKPSVVSNDFCYEIVSKLQTWEINESSTEDQMVNFIEGIKRLIESVDVELGK